MVCVSRSLKTVTLTLWGRVAEDQGGLLEALDAPVLAISACRVTNFNGACESSPPLRKPWNKLVMNTNHL